MIINDTIAAPATGMSNSGIGIIRISGSDSLNIVGRIFPRLTSMASHTIAYGFIYEDGKAVDEVMVSIMKGPHSYTREDVVEINCHGGTMMINKVLELVLRNGARLAEPGEFTKRAFLNGRIDLAEAEAVMDIIQAKNKFALKNSIGQLVGKVSDTIRSLREEIIYQVAYIESALDDPEHISLDGYGGVLREKVDDIIVRMDTLLKYSKEGRLLRDGIKTVILGKPNVGKSSLLNFLLGEERAIVTDIAGTTRDTLEEPVVIDGITLDLIDTAGIRETSDMIERMGVERTKKCIREADLIIYMVDSSLDMNDDDDAIIRLISDKKVIVLLNKTDLVTKVDEDCFYNFYNKVVDETDRLGEKGDNIYPHVDKYEDKPIIIRTMLTNNSNDQNGILQTIIGTIKEMFIHGGINIDEEVYLTNIRHQEGLLSAYESMILVKDSLINNMPEDFYTIDMMSAYSDLGLIIGELVDDDLVDEIFSKFCTGK